MANSSGVALSVNVNKIALIRNSREGNNPDLVAFARRCIDFGAAGITVHPRPDQRHIRPEDCSALAKLIETYKNARPEIEFNIEGNIFAAPRESSRDDFSDYPGMMALIEQCSPEQATLVPDNDTQLTSDHGFDLKGNCKALAEAIKRIKALGSRVSLFMNPDLEQISRARDVGADRIELYTGPFAQAFDESNEGLLRRLFDQHCAAAEHANACGMAVNAGHDLNLENLVLFRTLPHLLEVSIGHALTIDCLNLGQRSAVNAYVELLS